LQPASLPAQAGLKTGRRPGGPPHWFGCGCAAVWADGQGRNRQGFV